MAEHDDDETDYNIRFREDEEMEFFTELALHETERWIQAVTKQSFKYRDDIRKSLENGVLLCELLNGLKPGTIKRINKLPTPIAGLDNINVFLKACKATFGLTDIHLFNPSDLEDLSQRAIADSDHLKDEYDKRLRNVAVTIYWLGQQAASQPHLYQGPQLDLTAFSALVNRKHSDLVGRGDWAGGDVVTSQRQSFGGSNNSTGSNSRHTRDSSIDGYDKDSVTSLEDTSFEMPMNRYNSASALYANNNSTSTSNTPRSARVPSNDTSFDGGSGSVFANNANYYRSSPDIAGLPPSHRRYSSADSMDGSSHYSGHSGQSGGQSGSHSRQGSTSDEVSYPTRRLSTTISRRQSTSADPLQFIKSRGAQDLAAIAQVQMKVAEESRKEVVITRDTTEDDADWQSNLSTWKNRRKSQSERSYQLREELEKMEKEKEGGDVGPSLPTKTFSQIREERERRKSTGRKFYPIEDEEEESDEIFKPTTVSHLESSSKTDNKESNNFGLPGRNDGNNNNETNSSTFASSFSADRRASRSKLSEKLRSFDEDAQDFSWSDSSQQESRQRRSGNPDYSNGVSTDSSARTTDNGASFSSSTEGDATTVSHHERGSSSDKNNESGADSVMLRKSRESSYAATSRPSSSFNSSYNNSSSTNITNNGVQLTTKSVGSRTQSKIGSIMRNFEEGGTKKAAPKQGYNEKVDVSARKSAFEVSTANDPPIVPKLSINNKRDSFNREKGVLSRYQQESKEESDESSESEEETENQNIQKTEASVFNRGFNQSNTVDYSEQLEAPVTSAMDRSQLPNGQKDLGKDFIEKTIKISQAKNSDRGFGFFLTGGVDTDSPLAVSKVALGSSADVCDLRPQDQVLAVNNRDVTSMSATQVGDIIGQSVSDGNIELKVLRKRGEDDFDDEEDFSSSSDEGEENLASPGYKHSQVESTGQTSVMDQLAAERQWLEQQIQQGEINNAEQDKGDNSADSQENTDNQTHTATLTWPQEKDTNEAENAGEGPPNVLRKWQRQRQKEEYTFTPAASEGITDTFRKISLNVATPRPTENDFDPNDEAPSATSWDRRQEQWTREQDAARQHGTPGGTNTNQAQFEEGQERIRTAYQVDIQRADEKEEERQRKEAEMLQPEIDKAALLEERRAERRARIFNTAAAATSSASTSVPPSATASYTSQQFGPEQVMSHRAHLYGGQFESGPDRQQASSQDSNRQHLYGGQFEPNQNRTETPSHESHRAHLYGNQFESEPDRQQTASPPGGVYSTTTVLHTSSVQHQIQPQQSGAGTFVVPTQQEGVFVIDPRNRQDTSDYTAKPVAFHVNLASSAKAPDSSALIEAERERIRLEELRKIEEERKKAKQELKAKEEEEMRKIKEKEEQLLREKELLRLEREKFLREQEEFRRLKEEQERQAQQQKHQLQQHNATSYRASPQETNQTNTYGAAKHNNTANTQNHISTNHFTPRPYTSNLPKWPPVSTNGSNNTNVNNSIDSPRRAKGFSREEMLSPSRQPAVAPESGGRAWRSPADYKNDQQQQQQTHSQYQQQQIQPQYQQTKQPPYQQQKQPQYQQDYTRQNQNRSHSPDQGPSPNLPNKKSPFPSMGDHWLVEEAERRRLAESDIRLSQLSNKGQTIVGPIKPHPELPNRWRGGEREHGPRQRQPPAKVSPQPSPSMPAAIRQTLLEKTASARVEAPNDMDLPPPPPPHEPYRLSPSIQSPGRSPARSPSGYRSVSPPSRSTGSPNVNPNHHPYHNQQQSSNHQQQEPAYFNQHHQQRQQIQHSPNSWQQQQQQQKPSNYPPKQYPNHTSYNKYPGPYNNSPQQFPNQHPGSYNNSPQQFPDHSQPPPPPEENGMPVSGTHLCSYCGQELGFGAAMVIESLGLYFHVDCFRCCVCHTSLGTGVQGADVRVRANRLHCPDCYSNDEAGLKFSKV